MVPVAVLLAATLGADPAPAATAPPPREARPDLLPDVAELERAGIEPTADGIREYLARFRPAPDDDARVRRLVGRLPHPDYHVREAATRDLIAYRYLPPELLLPATLRDPESAHRVDRVVREAHHASYEALTYPALRVVAGRRLRGLGPLLLDLLPRWREYYQTEAAARAVAASAVAGDLPLLRQALGNDRPAVRAAAAGGVAAVLGPASWADLDPLLSDPDHAVVLAVATALLDQGSRKPLATLVRLIEGGSGDARAAAADVLRAVTGRADAGETDPDPARRAAAAAVWAEWVRRDGPTAALRLPARPPAVWRARVLICLYDKRVLREIDLVTGKVTFEQDGLSYPWGCHATTDGVRLAADYMTKEVIEYDAGGRERSRRPVPGRPTGLEKLPGGRTLVPLSDTDRVIELDADGRIVWDVAAPGRPTTAQRLANGNTLVTLQFGQKVVEVDRAGREVWRVAVPGRPHTAQRLPGGNTLVCDIGGTVTEYDRDGKTVWSKTGLNNPAQAQRLPSGNTLVSDATGLAEYDRAGGLVRRFDGTRSRFHAY